MIRFEYIGSIKVKNVISMKIDRFKNVSFFLDFIEKEYEQTSHKI